MLKNLSIGSSNRSAREVWLEKTLTGLAKGSKILDAGAGELKYRNLCSHLEYVSQDFGQYDGKGDGVGLQTGNWDQTKLDLVCDITDIPVEDNSFDAVMCIEVFEHLPNPLGAIREFQRILRPGGKAIVTAPFASLTHFAPYHFSTGFNRYFYEHHFTDMGFSLDEVSSNGNYFEYIGQEIRRLSSTAKKYAGRKPNLFQLGCMYFLLRFLQKCSRRDTGSSELLNYGYHVIAVKN